MRMAIPEIDHDKCTGCADCVDQCPTKAVIVRPEDCSYCTECVVFCSLGAIRCPFEIVLVRGEPEGLPEKRRQR